ncbi:AAA family ATPase [Chachezhania antarctica]|uniref:bifunctional aminoglycoside phosphotransferase/ATP-binding protein n=1 Tax=Chachezhania antarctica TaxID=2340860 RepID=UPI000EB4567D|nr:bifunctional aminoglycoside phosphotransferase/ATP-binding protein [Chachezhania antarctica]|tara:strand:- start:354 stop:1889 length:1536 start_codon:yes stop_codon:yes gene_type:complete
MDQTETIDFLKSGAGFEGDDGSDVEVVETHCSVIFLQGDAALKLKRAVTYDYLDLSTVDLRHAILDRELELNRPAAPSIYRDVMPVTRAGDGLALGGDGEAVDWVLRMNRFPAENELERIAERGDFDDRLATDTGAAIARYHEQTPERRQPGRAMMADILDELGRVFAEFPGADGTGRVSEWQDAAARALDRVGACLDVRGRDGHVRRAHGDLHLRNLVVIDGRPVPFDALEFDEDLGTCDLLYDIGFLIMDLLHRDLDRQGCRVLDAWLRDFRGAQDAGLAALPLFLSVRAAIRAMVQLQTDAARERAGASADAVAAYLDLACRALDPGPPRLIAVGGFSGSGKSVLARALAPGLGALPGAVLLSSDLERKAGQRPDEKLATSDYAPDRRDAVYEAMFDRAATILDAGHSVILDATFIDPALRDEAEATAARTGVPFSGFWLDAPRDTLTTRLEARVGDASDADSSVLMMQLETGTGPLSWQKIDASGTPRATLDQARQAMTEVEITGPA